VDENQEPPTGKKKAARVVGTDVEDGLHHAGISADKFVEPKKHEGKAPGLGNVNIGKTIVESVEVPSVVAREVE
jgi:hypothetical protein